MAKLKIKKKEKSEKKEPKTLTIKKPQFKIKIEKIDFKNLLKSKNFKVFLMVLAAVLAFGLVDLFFQYLNNDYSVAVINGSRISKNDFHNQLEKMYGATVAQQLIDQKIIELEAKQEKITTSDDEIQQKLDEIIANVGGEEAYQTALKANNITEEELKDQIKVDLLSRKMIEPSLEYTEDDIKAFFEQYSASLYPNETAALEEGEKLDYELFKDGVKDIYIQQEVQNQQYTWLSDLYSNYNIQNNTTSKPKYGFLTATINIVTNLVNETNSNEKE